MYKKLSQINEPKKRIYFILKSNDLRHWQSEVIKKIIDLNLFFNQSSGN